MNKISAETTFSACVEELSNLMTWFEQAVAPLAMESKILHKTELALEEAVVNIIRHGYRNEIGTIQILIEGQKMRRLSITIKDQAPAFNPLTQAPGILETHSLDQTREGGWGIHFMRQSVDEMHYRRDDDQNILILIMHFSQRM